jgi:hypothetical protein
MSRTNRLLTKLLYGLMIAIVLTIAGYFYTTTCLRLPGAAPCTRVLFIGNSYTSTNDLPVMFEKLSRAGGQKVMTGISTPGGWSLSDHVNSTDTSSILSSQKWNVVVLQEQSLIPAFAQTRMQGMLPAARTLVQQVKDDGATPLFFLTWGYRDGEPASGLSNYADMQYQLNYGYLSLSQLLHVSVAPVGVAWAEVINERPDLNLWQEDGSHPNQMGTYLAACVFYAMVFNQSPVGLTYNARIPKQTALELQTIASDIVFKQAGKWFLP